MFLFKQFSVSHSKSVLKVGTDAVLLGCLAEPGNSETILDIGTGCGVIALMLAQKSKASIDAIEVDKDSYEEAAINFQNSPWPERLHAIHSSFQDFYQVHQAQYDLIVCNPPFFEEVFFERGNNPQKISSKREISSTEKSLDFKELVNGVSILLSEHGSWYVIIPFIRVAELTEFAFEKGLYLVDETDIRSKENTHFIRAVLCFSKQESKPVIPRQLTIYTMDGKRSDAYAELAKEYYL